MISKSSFYRPDKHFGTYEHYFDFFRRMISPNFFCLKAEQKIAKHHQ